MDDILWAPWRIGYVAESEADRARRLAEEERMRVAVRPDGDPDCFLCQAAVETQWKRRHVIGRTETTVADGTVAVLNKYPYNNGHLLIAPVRHVDRLDKLTEAEMRTLSRELGRWVRRLEETIKPQGFNIGLNLGHVAGAGLPGHLHWHIVPRWSGDTNYMATVAGTKVIPQALDALWELIVEK